MRADAILRASRACARHRLRGAPRVHAASLMLTRACNLRCGYCSRNERRGPELSTAQWITLLDELAQLGCLQVSFTGGEPLIRRDLAELLAHCRRLGIRTGLNTNGLLVTRHMDTVRLADGVTLSVDGPEGPHDRSRGAGSYRAVMHAARALVDAGLPTRFYTVLSRANLDHLGALLRDAEALGITVFFQPGTAELLGSEAPNPTAPDPAAYRAAVDQLIAWRRAGRPVGNSPGALRYLRSWPDEAPQRCAWGLFCRIEEDGSLRTCGRDTQRARIDAATLGLAEALRRRPAPRCTSCWTAARVELHLMARGEPSAILSYARSTSGLQRRALRGMLTR